MILTSSLWGANQTPKAGGCLAQRTVPTDVKIFTRFQLHTCREPDSLCTLTRTYQNRLNTESDTSIQLFPIKQILGYRSFGDLHCQPAYFNSKYACPHIG